MHVQLTSSLPLLYCISLVVVSVMIIPVIFCIGISFIRFAESSRNGDETPEEEDTKVDNETKRFYTSKNILIFVFPVATISV